MPKISIVDSGRIDDRDSAFPQAVQMPDGEILCSYVVGGGPNATGKSEFSSSSDHGKTWQHRGTILELDAEKKSSNALKLSLTADQKTIFAYGARQYRDKNNPKFGHGRTEAVYCTSTDQGNTWSNANIIPTPWPHPLEISFGIVPLQSGRLLAPMATLPKNKLGERILTYISDDNGKTWNRYSTVFEDPEKKYGFFEHKFTEFAPGKIMAAAWTVTLDSVEDRQNSFAISTDNGDTWSPFRNTGITGQTMAPVTLGNDLLLVLYNKRQGKQGIIMNIVRFTEEKWEILFEDVLYDTFSRISDDPESKIGVDSFDDFAFGFPTAVKLQNGNYLATFWSKENKNFGISWTLLEIEI